MQRLPRNTLVASAALGGLIAAPTAYIFGGASIVIALLGLVAGAGCALLVRRAAGARLWLVAVLTAAAVMVVGPLLVAIGWKMSGHDARDSFWALLLATLLYGQLVATPLGLVAGVLHGVVARVTTPREATPT